MKNLPQPQAFYHFACVICFIFMLITNIVGTCVYNDGTTLFKIIIFIILIVFLGLSIMTGIKLKQKKNLLQKTQL